MTNAQKYVETVLSILEICENDENYSVEVRNLGQKVYTLKYEGVELVSTDDVEMVKYHIDTNEDNKIEDAYQRGCIPS